MKKRLFNILTLAVMLALMWLLQALLMPKYMSASPEGNMIGEYYDQAGNHDVVFIGDCEVYENFSPVTLWESCGIPSYIRGSAQQLIWQSYYLMEETFRYETPKVMVFNVLSMEFGDPASAGPAAKQEAYNRMTLDTMRWSSSKWKSMKASMTEMEKEKGGAMLYLFPLLRYHDRWSELKREDFRYLFRREPVTDAGYLMQVGVRPMETEHASMPLADYTLPKTSFAYLDKMVKLCEEHGTQLVLVKAPILYPVWWPQWDQQLADYAQAHNLMYLNLTENIADIGIDWSTDTYDTGLHLNVYGAEKLSDYFGRILMEQCGLTDRRGDPDYDEVWTEISASYHQRKAELQKQQNS